MKNVVALLERWVKDHVIRLPKVEILPSLADQKEAGTFSITKGIATHLSSRKIFNEKHKDHDILL